MIAEKTKSISRETLFIHLYETAFPKAAGFIHKMGGTLEEAKDIFQDALLIYYEKKTEGDLTAETDTTNYLNGIVRHLWYKKFRDNTNLRPLNADVYITATEEAPKVSDRVLHLIAASGKKCLDLLSAFYYEQLNMKDLAEKFGFSGERSATAQKYKCLEKIRNAVKNKNLTKDDFYE